MKRGILLAAFGSSNQQARRTLDRFDHKIRSTFPDIPVRWAFTSGFIRRKLADEGLKTDSVQKALRKMWFEKFTHVAVQSLHVVPGAEFNELLHDARAFSAKDSCDNPQKIKYPDDAPPLFEHIIVGAPLMADAYDATRVALAVKRHLPRERTPEEAVVLMGHGTWHQGNSMYDLLAAALRDVDPLVSIGTMADADAIQDIAAKLARAGVARVWLLPLLAVAGAHVVHDMTGDHPESWKSVITAAGIACLPILTSATEYDGFAAIWIDHLREAMTQLV